MMSAACHAAPSSSPSPSASLPSQLPGALAAKAPRRPAPVQPKVGIWEAQLPLGYVRFELQRGRQTRIVGLERFHSCKGGPVSVIGTGAPGVAKRRFASRSAGLRGRFLTGGTAVVELRDPCSRQSIQVLAHRVGAPTRVLRGVYTGADVEQAPVRVRIWDPSATAAGAGVDCGRGQRLCRVEVTLAPIVCSQGLPALARRLPVGPVGAGGAIRLVGQGVGGTVPTILVAQVEGTAIRGTITVAGACGEFVAPFEVALIESGQIAGAAVPPA